MSKVYSIKNWEKWFENAQSTRYKNISWIPIPNKHDGKGYRRISILPDGNNINVFTTWILLVQIASKMPVRGILADESGALDYSDFEAMTGYPATMFQTAIPFLLHRKIDWLEVVDYKEFTNALRADSEQTPSLTSGIRKNKKEKNENKKEKEKVEGVSLDSKKEVKHKYGEYQKVLLTDEEYKKLVVDYRSSGLKALIKLLDEGIQQHGYKYKDHNLTLRKWAISNKIKKLTPEEIYDEQLSSCTEGLRQARREAESAEFKRIQEKAKERFGKKIFDEAMEFINFEAKREGGKK